MTDKIEFLKKHKISLWVDNINRSFLSDGSLQRYIDNLHITGLTSNPTIFEKAILANKAYDTSFEILLKKGYNEEEILESLMVEDIQLACDSLNKIYEESNRRDGYVSMEISPLFSFDSEKIIKESLRLYEKVGRKNLMIKIPATESGIKALEELIYSGVNINMTLIFSPFIYERTALSYIRGVEKRIAAGFSEHPYSVASFFISRIDTAVDQKIEYLLETNHISKDEANKLKGQIAISTALMAYEKYLNLFFTDKFMKLSMSGAKEQRIVWASTSSKNPSYRASKYIEELTLADTINTAPIDTIESFYSSGLINEVNIYERISYAKYLLTLLSKFNISMEDILKNLQKDGIEKFIYSHNKLLGVIGDKINRSKNMTEKANKIMPENHDITEEIKRLNESNFLKSLWEKETSIFKKEQEHQKIIRNSLGWLDIPFKMYSKIKEIEDFTNSIKEEGYKYAVLLGMGGSSLAPEVYKSLYQKNNYPKLIVLDTTNPESILKARKTIDIKKTLFIFSSKSGGTIEPNSQFKYFFSEVKKSGIKNPGNNFIAITDKNTSLEKLALSKKFKKIFINPSDIGGRFSALSYFGLIPASICGANIKLIIEKSLNMAKLCQNNNINENPGLILGSIIYNGFKLGKDKLTIILPEKLKTFGLWIEQLVAESTGKEGKGIVPVCENILNDIENCSRDRNFITVEFENFRNQQLEDSISTLKNEGHRVYRIFIEDIYDISAEFFRWEIATATAGFLMEINPFDQPDVQFSKKYTIELISEFVKTRKMSVEKPIFENDYFSVFFSDAINKNKIEFKNEEELFSYILSNLKENDYLVLLAYLCQAADIDKKLYEILKKIKEVNNVASFYSYGPRYLHSTGQLFKGGKDNGLFLILTHKSKKDIKIDGERYTFGQLHMAQAIGDFKALNSKNRRAIRIDIKKELEKSLKYISESISEQTRTEYSREEKMVKLAERKKNTKLTNVNATQEYIVIDYPKNLETITSNHYTIRIGSTNTDRVEISIDDNPWQNCRHSVGYWWYDWNNISKGTHQIVARMHLGNGNYLVSKRRRCKVA